MKRSDPGTKDPAPFWRDSSWVGALAGVGGVAIAVAAYFFPTSDPSQPAGPFQRAPDTGKGELGLGFSSQDFDPTTGRLSLRGHVDPELDVSDVVIMLRQASIWQLCDPPAAVDDEGDWHAEFRLRDSQAGYGVTVLLVADRSQLETC